MCKCDSCVKNRNICGCNQTNNCDCKIKLTTNCINYEAENLPNIGIFTGDTGTTVIKKISNFLENTVQNDVSIVNVGLGRRLVKGFNIQGETEIRSVTSSDGSVSITEGADTIDFSVSSLTGTTLSRTGSNNTSANNFNIELGGTGTDSITLVQPTGLEYIDQGNGRGWRLIEASSQSQIGNMAVDLSPFIISTLGDTLSIESGARGFGSFAALGGQAIAPRSLSIGLSSSNGEFSSSIGSSSNILYGTANQTSILDNIVSRAEGDSSMALAGGFSQGLSSISIGNSIDRSQTGLLSHVKSHSIGAYSFTAIGGTSFGENSISMGYSTISRSFGEMVVGLNNEDYSPFSENSFNPSDKIFVVGNGSSPINRSNALSVYKNGATQLHPLNISNIVNPERGMVIFNSNTNKHQGYDGTQWNDLY